MRILLLITDLEIGGTPMVVRELAIRLRAAGEEVEVACLKGWGPVATQLQRAGVPVKAFAGTSLMDLHSVVGELQAFIRLRKFDTVFSFLIHANTIAAMASCGLTGVRWMQSIQTTQPSPRWHWWLQRIVQHAAEKIVVPSESVAQVALDWADVPAEKITIIPNAVEIPRGTGASSVSSVARHGRDARATNRIGFIGRLDPIKCVPDLVAAMATLPAGASLHIWGEGRDRQRIEATIAKFNLAGRITLRGVIASPTEALEQIDCLVLPSAAEGFGLVLIEAMAAGVPVVATNVPGIRDVVRHGETGILVESGNVLALSNAIESLLGDPSLRSRLTSRAMQDVATRFSWGVVLPQYLQLLGA